MSIRSDLFEALANEFPSATIRYSFEFGRMTFVVSEYIPERGTSLSVGFAVLDEDAESCRYPELMIEAHVKNARANWDEEISSSRDAHNG